MMLLNQIIWSQCLAMGVKLTREMQTRLIQQYICKISNINCWRNSHDVFNDDAYMAPKIEVSKVLLSRQDLSQGLVLLAGCPGQPWSNLIDVTRLTRFHHRSLQQSTPHPTLICKRRLHHEAAVQFEDRKKWAKIGTTRPLVQTDNKTSHIRTATWHLEKLSY